MIERLLEGERGSLADHRPSLSQVLIQVQMPLLCRCRQRLQEQLEGLIEAPALRTGGAIHAIRLLLERFREMHQQYTTLHEDLMHQAGEPHHRIEIVLLPELRNDPRPRRAAALRGEMIEQLGRYARLRFHLLLLKAVLDIQESLESMVRDFALEVEFCQQRLMTLWESFSDNTLPDPDGGPDAEHLLLPPDWVKLRITSVETIRELGQSGEHEFGLAVQGAICDRFTSLSRALLAEKDETFQELKELLLREAERFLDGRVDARTAAEVFLAAYPTAVGAERAITGRFAAAALPLVSGGQCAVLIVPHGPAGEKIAEQARCIFPTAVPRFTSARDEIIFYRDRSGLLLTDLEQFSPEAREAYEAMFDDESLSPHNRLDVPEWRPRSRP